MSVRIQDGAKLFASVEGAKLHHTKINLYTIFTYTMVKMYPNIAIHNRCHFLTFSFKSRRLEVSPLVTDGNVYVILLVSWDHLGVQIIKHMMVIIKKKMLNMLHKNFIEISGFTYIKFYANNWYRLDNIFKKLNLLLYVFNQTIKLVMSFCLWI